MSCCIKSISGQTLPILHQMQLITWMCKHGRLPSSILRQRQFQLRITPLSRHRTDMKFKTMAMVFCKEKKRQFSSILQMMNVCDFTTCVVCLCCFLSFTTQRSMCGSEKCRLLETILLLLCVVMATNSNFHIVLEKLKD